MAAPASRGRSSRNFRQLRQVVLGRRWPCCRCGQAIDYNLPYRDPLTGEVNENSATVDHYPYPLSQRPDLAEDLSNLYAAHLRCNSEALNGGVQYRLGATSRRW